MSKAKVKCPYCGHEWERKYDKADMEELKDFSPTVEREICDPDEGGCDKFFFTETDLEVSVKTYKREEG